MSEPLLVAILSRHPLTRAGLTRLLDLDPARARVVSLDDGQPVRCDVVVYDPAGREPSEDPDLQRLVASGRPVVGLRPEPARALAESLLAMGVADVVSMEVSGEALLSSVERSAAGWRSTAAAARGQARDVVRDATGLTVREIAVLELIAAGLSNAEVADALHVSINTVKTYIRSAYSRIGADSRSQAVIWAIHHGLGPAAEPTPSAAEAVPTG